MEIDGQPSIAEHETCDRYTADRSAKCPANKAREDKHALLTWTLQTERTDWTAGYTGVRSSVPIMHTAVKKSALLELARSRQMDTMDGYSRKYFQFKDFDCDWDHVVPWTISACNVDADLMLIAQDWASEDFLNGLTEVQQEAQRAFGQFPDLPTNKRTKELLAEHMSISFCETYATKAFAFVKPGKMDAHIPFHDLVRSAAAYAHAPDRDCAAENGVVSRIG